MVDRKQDKNALSDGQLNELLNLANDCSDPADQPFAPDPRTPACLSMPRLRTLGNERDAITAAEDAHVEACAICASRLAAFRRHHDVPLQPLPMVPQSFAVRGWGAAAAAALLLVGVLLFLTTTADENSPTTAPQFVPWEVAENQAASQQVTGTAELSAFSAPLLAGVWVEDFDRVAADCSVVAFIRAWDETCACLRWRQHHWVDADGKAQLSQTLARGERIEVEIEVPGATPPVEQLVLVATASNAADLPTSEAAAQRMLECLAEPQCLDDVDAIATYVSTAPGCFADGVRLIPRSFMVE
ncbi:MAG: hypothetical protein AAF581_21350 [Planctomycetota bacterium]